MRALNRLAAPPSGLDGFGPARRDEARREIGQRREDKQALLGEPVRDDEVGWAGRIGRTCFRRSLDVDPVATEHEEVEIQLAGTPTLPIAPPERPLQSLEAYEQRQRASSGIRTERDVDRDDGVAELWLVDDANRLCRIERRDAPQARARQRRQGVNAGGHGRSRIAEIRPKPDVRPHSPGQGRPPDR